MFNNKCFHFQIIWIISIIQCHGTRNDLARYGAKGREQKNFQMKLKRYILLLLEIYFFESLSKRNLWLIKFAPFIDLYFKSHKLSFLVGGGLEWQNVKYMSYNMYQVFESPHSNACLGLVQRVGCPLYGYQFYRHQTMEQCIARKIKIIYYFFSL